MPLEICCISNQSLKVEIPTNFADLKEALYTTEGKRQRKRFSVFNRSVKNETWKYCGDVPEKNIQSVNKMQSYED